jgi:zinc protease
MEKEYAAWGRRKEREIMRIGTYRQAALCCASSLLLLASCATRGRPAPQLGEIGARPFGFGVRDLRLPSGLRVVVHEDHRAPMVVFTSIVEGGTAAGPDGLAELVARLTRRARPRPPYTLDELLDQAGASGQDISTSFDATVFAESAPRRALPTLVALEAARLTDPLAAVDEDSLVREREQLAWSRDAAIERGDRDELLSAIGEQVLPKGHPYARASRGTPASVRRLGLGAARAFAAAHYRPDVATWIIVGDVDVARLDRLLAATLPPALLGDPRHPVSRSDSAPPARAIGGATTGFVVVPTLSAAGPELWVTWPFREHGDTLMLRRLLEPLLQKVLEEPVQWVPRGGAHAELGGFETFSVGGREGGLFVCRLRLGPGADPRVAGEYVLDRLTAFWFQPDIPRLVADPDGMRRWYFSHIREQLHEVTVEQLRLRVAQEFLLDVDDPWLRARRLEGALQGESDAAALSRQIGQLTHLSSTRLERWAFDHLSRASARFVAMVPGAPENVSPASAKPPIAPDEPRLPRALGALERLEAPGSPQSMRALELPNGLQVVLLRHPGVPVVAVALAARGGTAMAQPPGVVEVAAQVVDRGRLGKRIDEIGARATSESGPDRVTFELSAGADHLDRLLTLAYGYATHTSVPLGAVAEFRTHALPGLLEQETSALGRADVEFRRALYGRLPFYRGATASDLARVERGDVERWLHATWRPSNAVLAVAGEIDLDHAERAVRDILGPWSDPDDLPRGEVRFEVLRRPPVPKPEVKAQPLRLAIARPGRPGAELRFGCLLAPSSGEGTDRTEDLATELVARRFEQALASHGAGILEDRPEPLRIWPSVDLAAHVGGGRLGELLATLPDPAAGLLAPATPGEIERAVWALAHRHAVTFAAALPIAEAFVAATPGPSTQVVRYPQLIRAVPPARLDAALERCRQTQVWQAVADPVYLAASGWTVPEESR